MSTIDAEAVAVIPVAVLSSELRHSALSVEARKQNHLAMGMGGERYLVVHPTYSLSPRCYSLRVLVAWMLILLEVALSLFVLLGLCTPFFMVGRHGYFAFDGGSGGSAAHASERYLPLVILSVLTTIYLLLFSPVCPILMAVCLSRDQHTRLSEELFNRELLGQHGAQVHEDGRVYGPGGEPSMVKEEGMWGPCCGFEANERSRRSKIAWLWCAQCAVVQVSLILQCVIVYDMKWVYTMALTKHKTATHGKGLKITVCALVMRTLELFFYCGASFYVMCRRGSREMPHCQLIPLSGSRAAGALATSGGAADFDKSLPNGEPDEDYPTKLPSTAAEREENCEMEAVSMRNAPSNSSS
ncbi:hypothetical protein LSCM1_03544 [Leishmania martiniquensis]|uniref:Uncharacterized protein n=1 Tax=Leishmania martiniquensis TaxID=1580590 RepID=A0A836GX22_9TRYP|nr:hypothetical protein LSCM1_03544 [Leishmania martiniquensis]